MPEPRTRSCASPLSEQGFALLFPGHILACLALSRKPDAPLILRCGERSLDGPSRSLLLRTAAGGLWLVFGVPITETTSGPLLISEGDTPISRLAVTVDPAATSLCAVVEDLPPAESGRLLAWLLEFGQTSRLAQCPPFTDACLAAARAGSDRMRADAWGLGDSLVCLTAFTDRRHRLTRAWALASGVHRPGLFPPAQAGQVVAQLIDAAPLGQADGDAGRPPLDLQAVLIERPGDRPLLIEPNPGRDRRPLKPCLEAAPQPARLALASYLWHCLSPLHGRPGVADTLRALAGLRDAPRAVVKLDSQPVAAALHCVVPTEDGQVFVRGTLIDPETRVTGLSLELPYRAPVALDLALRFDDRAGATALGHDAGWNGAGFLARLSDQPPVGIGGVTARGILHLPGGDSVACVAPRSPTSPFEARTAVLGGLAPHDLPPQAMAEVLAPVVAVLQRRALATPRVADTVVIGRPVASPRRSIVIPLYQTLDFIRFQMAAFAVDPDWADSEIIYVLDSPEQRTLVERELRDRCRVFGLAVTLVVMTRNFGYAPAVNAGVAAGRAPGLILLNSDVVPITSGWMRRLDTVAEAAGDAGAVGPRLLFHDGSLQHAGLYFDRSLDGDWLNRHFWKGYPGEYAPALAVRAVPAVTGACMRIDRALYERVGGLTEDYVIGDYEDSDLCLKMIAAGRRNIHAGDTALYHFERCSITRHDGYERTLVSTYNRWLHIQRWDHEMTAAMARFAPETDSAA